MNAIVIGFQLPARGDLTKDITALCKEKTRNKLLRNTVKNNSNFGAALMTCHLQQSTRTMNTRKAMILDTQTLLEKNYLQQNV
jgi:hypothetical protein